MNYRNLLLTNGYVQIPALSSEEAQEIKSACLPKLDAEGSIPFEGGLTLTMTLPYDKPAIRCLIERAKQVLFTLGFSDVIFWSARLINKVPGEGERHWHQDWIPWHENVSYGDEPPQIGVMLYLQETKRENGALRVLPGKHKDPARIKRIYTECAIGEMEGEVTVEASPQDVTVVDARLPHATWPNTSEEGRAMMTLWFIPNYGKLPEGLQEYFSRTQEWADGYRPYKGDISGHEIRFDVECIRG